MTLQVDPVLGAAYLDPEAFAQRAHVFGVGMSIQNATRDSLLALLADASRRVDEICGRAFTPDPITETHAWNERTRRVCLNAPPCVELISFKVVTGKSVSAQFNVDEVYVNNQENYLEVVSFGSATILSTPVLAFGLSQVQAEVTYKTFQDPPAAVKRATGMIAAYRANSGFVNALVPAQFGALQVGGQKFNNVQVEEPAAIREALGDFIRIPIA
jgi:hypothetical protein